MLSFSKKKAHKVSSSKKKTRKKASKNSEPKKEKSSVVSTRIVTKSLTKKKSQSRKKSVVSKVSKRFDTQQELASLDLSVTPRHVAIILDGNGRWAAKKGLSRSQGHRAGGETLDRLLDFFIDLNVSVVSLYAFSTENWKRPKAEVKAIWQLLNEFFKTRSQRAMEKGICIRASGDLDALPFRSRRLIKKVIQKTQNNTNLVANFCVNYGSRNEITQATNRIVQERLEQWKRGDKKSAKMPVQEDEFEKYLYTSGLPDVDLLVRPGGEFRISNFLLWQIAYAEIYVTDTLWPDFTKNDMIKAVKWYQKRNRRFGGL